MRRNISTLLGLVLLSTALVSGIPSAPPSAADGNEAPGAPADYRSITAGTQHGCGVLDDGSVKCWGAGDSGALGQGTTTDAGGVSGQMGADLPAVPLGTGRTATAVSAGNSYSCALLDDATVKCWGEGGNGRLGQGSTADRGDGPGEMGDNLPAINLGTGRTATAIASGGAHACAILDNATVKCWGSNSQGQLGQSDTLSRGDGPGEMGDNLPAINLGTGRTATAVTAGASHTCALLDNATVKCWGNNSFGALGQGSTLHRGDGPNEMGDNLAAVDLGTGRTATAITAGSFSHNCAILDNATVKCWGANSEGQLGIGDDDARGSSAVQMGDNLPAVDLGTGRTATAVTAGTLHTCARLDDATVKCWGENSAGQLGQGDTVARGDDPGETGDALPPIDLGTGRTATALTAGDGSACATLDDDTHRCWGSGVNGNLGNGFLDPRGDQPGEMGDDLPLTEIGGTGAAGHLTDAVTGEDLPGIMVALLDSGDFSLAGAALANGNGDYSTSLSAGDYFTFAIDPTVGHESGFLGDPTLTTVTTGLSVAGGAMAPTTGSIDGTVTATPGGAPIPGAMAIALSGTTGAAERGVVADGSGQFTIPDLRVGNHFVAYIDPAGAHQVQFHEAGSVIATATPVAVTPGGTTNADGGLPTQPIAGSGAALTGLVTEDETGDPLSGAFVLALRATDFSLVRATTTDPAGRYTLFVPPGSGYKLLFLDPSGARSPEWHDDRAPSDLAGAATVAAPAATNAALSPAGGSVEGRVTRTTGGAVDDAWAVAVGPNGVAGGDVAPDQTLVPGSFDIDGLAPGNYRIAFIDPRANVVEFWHDAPDYATGTLFAIAAGDETVITEALGP